MCQYSIECDQRWTVLRNKYATLKKSSRNRPSGSESYSITWPYYELMKFLDPFIIQRKTITNFSAPQSIPESSAQYSGIHNIITDTDSEEEVHNSMDEEEESMDDTQALYENFIEKRKLLAKIPPTKRIKSIVPEPSAEVTEKPIDPTQHFKESQILNRNKNFNEIKRLRNIKKNKR
ncbi:unnamed protein product [Phaedon cochleariae]|uniref:MADF domain-containing protein n=1 Tax=Phaedon cochleariae TaxID=80249 RepID=A0A9N9SJJ6_PHACE|nr:unnamed protein product [Phaedon cochleariae]